MGWQIRLPTPAPSDAEQSRVAELHHHESEATQRGRGAARVVRRGNRPNLEVLEERRLLATIDWISTTSGDWNNKSNWSTGQVPGAE